MFLGEGLPVAGGLGSASEMRQEFPKGGDGEAGSLSFQSRRGGWRVGRAETVQCAASRVQAVEGSKGYGGPEAGTKSGVRAFQQPHVVPFEAVGWENIPMLELFSDLAAEGNSDRALPEVMNQTRSEDRGAAVAGLGGFVEPLGGGNGIMCQEPQDLRMVPRPAQPPATAERCVQAIQELDATRMCQYSVFDELELLSRMGWGRFEQCLGGPFHRVFCCWEEFAVFHPSKIAEKQSHCRLLRWLGGRCREEGISLEHIGGS